MSTWSRETMLRNRSRLAADPSLAAHGTVNAYTNWGCRCDLCRTAHSVASYDARVRRFYQLTTDPTVAPHGVASTYGNWGCRCGDCTAAWAKDARDRTARRKAKANNQESRP